jgi:hypothetical protein
VLVFSWGDGDATPVVADTGGVVRFPDLAVWDPHQRFEVGGAKGSLDPAKFSCRHILIPRETVGNVENGRIQVGTAHDDYLPNTGVLGVPNPPFKQTPRPSQSKSSNHESAEAVLWNSPKAYQAGSFDVGIHSPIKRVKTRR